GEVVVKDCQSPEAGSAPCEKPPDQQQAQAQNTAQTVMSVLNGAAKETLNEAKSLFEMTSPLGPLVNALVPDLQASNSTEKAGMIADAVVLALVPIGEEAKVGESVSVYTKAETSYVGITSRMAAREAEHGEKLVEVVGGLTRS